MTDCVNSTKKNWKIWAKEEIKILIDLVTLIWIFSRNHVILIEWKSKLSFKVTRQVSEDVLKSIKSLFKSLTLENL